MSGLDILQPDLAHDWLCTLVLITEFLFACKVKASLLYSMMKGSSNQRR